MITLHWVDCGCGIKAVCYDAKSIISQKPGCQCCNQHISCYFGTRCTWGVQPGKVCHARCLSKEQLAEATVCSRVIWQHPTLNFKGLAFKRFLYSQVSKYSRKYYIGNIVNFENLPSVFVQKSLNYLQHTLKSDPLTTSGHFKTLQCASVFTEYFYFGNFKFCMYFCELLSLYLDIIASLNEGLQWSEWMKRIGSGMSSVKWKCGQFCESDTS